VLQHILSILAVIRVFFRSRSDTALEILALRQQVAVLKRKRPRPTLNSLDRLFWTFLRGSWSRWKEVLVIVKPETVIAWHRAGFRLYWRWRSRLRGGRPKITEEVRNLIRRLAEENCASRISQLRQRAHSDSGWLPTGALSFAGRRTPESCLTFSRRR
jgi:putative transposase